MKKFFLLLGALTALAASATDITVGSYNIRTLTAADRGANHWDARKEYVARTITDNYMDVVGFNEVMNNRQYDELSGLLSGYRFYNWDGQENFNPGSETAINVVAWRADKFEAMESGYFFLNRDPEHKVWNENPWDNSTIGCVRHTAWVRLRVKDTGEEFVMMSTHLDHQGNIARMLGSYVNVDKSWEIAGSLPTILVGDMNSNTSRLNVFYIAKANFYDAYTESPNGLTDLGEDSGTSSCWNAEMNTRRIDFIYYRGFDINGYYHCTDQYDLGAYPSDHLAIKAHLTLKDPAAEKFEIYVKPGADGDGSKDNPFGDITKAVSAAPRFGATIYVAEGDYTLSKTVSIAKSMKILGGYNDDFTEVTGLSRFDAQNAFRAFSLKEYTQVEMHNVGIYNGATTSATADGAGIMAHGSRVILENCEFADNNSLRDGGALDITNQAIIRNCRFLRNSAVRYGGAICTDNPNKTHYYNQDVSGCTFIGNTAESGSALYLPRFKYGYVSGNTASGNIASNGATFYIHAIGSSNNLSSSISFFNNTVVNNRAEGENGCGAAYFELEPTSKVGIAFNTIFGNTSNPAMGAVYVQQGDPYINANILASNIGGDLFLKMDEVSAANNMVTCAGSSALGVSEDDPVASDFDSSNEILARVLDARVVDGVLTANLTLPAEGAPAEGMTDFRAPGVRVLDPAYSPTVSINAVSATRLRETTLRVDTNKDCMLERTALLATDQFGTARPDSGAATIGALEYDAQQGGVENIAADSFGAGNSLAPVEYYDLQGRRVLAPAKGIYIRRQGTSVTKIAL